MQETIPDATARSVPTLSKARGGRPGKRLDRDKKKNDAYDEAKKLQTQKDAWSSRPMLRQCHRDRSWGKPRAEEATAQMLGGPPRSNTPYSHESVDNLHGRRTKPPKMPSIDSSLGDRKAERGERDWSWTGHGRWLTRQMREKLERLATESINSSMTKTTEVLGRRVRNGSNNTSSVRTI